MFGPPIAAPPTLSPLSPVGSLERVADPELPPREAVDGQDRHRGVPHDLFAVDPHRAGAPGAVVDVGVVGRHGLGDRGAVRQGDGLADPLPLVEPHLGGVVGVADHVDDLVGGDLPGLHAPGERHREQREREDPVGAQRALVGLAGGRGGEDLQRGLVVEELLDDSVDVLLGLVVLARARRPGGDLDALAPHVGGAEVQGPLDQRVDDRHHPAQPGRGQQPVAGELGLGRRRQGPPGAVLQAELDVGQRLAQLGLEEVDRRLGHVELVADVHRLGDLAGDVGVRGAEDVEEGHGRRSSSGSGVSSG
jgi:hypothetical protein